MSEHCQIPRVVGMLLTGGNGGIAYLGGSVTQGRGASDTAETSWRALFQQYVMKEYHRTYYPHVGEIFSGLGGCNSPIATFFVERNVLSHQPALTFVEFCLNDRHVPDKNLAAKGIEGVIRQLLLAREPCDVIMLGAGCNPDGTTPDGQSGPVDFTLHRKIAEHYDLPFIDLQDYTYRRLEEKGQTWEEHISPTIEHDPNYHLNDYGQSVYFEAMREGFEEQVSRFRSGDQSAGAAIPKRIVPEPLFTDELQRVKLIDLARKTRGLVLGGDWEKKPQGLLPWYCDNVMMGKPGATVSLRFTGTAVMLWALVSYNGLNVSASLDGKEVSGAYLKYTLEFGRGFVLAHGLPHSEHVLELQVDQPNKRHNKLENPTAQLAAVGVAG